MRNAHRYVADALEPRRLLAVLINCTNVDDVVTVDLADDGLTISITLNGVTTTRNVGSETSVRVSGFFGHDTINVVDMVGLDLDVRGGDGNDTVTLGSGNGTSFDFKASTLTGDAGNDTLVFHDVELPTGLPGIERFDYEFGGGTVLAVHELVGTTTVPHQYAFESVRIDSGNAFSTFEVTSLGSESTLTLNGGAGADLLRLTPFATSATISFDGQAEGAQPPPLPPLPNRVTIDDTAGFAGVGAIYTLDAGTFDVGGFGLLQFTRAAAVSLRTHNGGADVEVLGVAAGDSTTVFGGAGDDAVFVGDGDYDSNILAPVSVSGGLGHDFLSVIDSDDAGGDTYTVNAALFTKANVPGAAMNFSVEEIAVNGNAAANVFEVRPNSASVVHIGGNNPTTSPGDRLVFVSAAPAGTATFAGGTYTFESAKDVSITQVETFPLPPVAASAADLRAEDDTGFSFTDNVTRVATPTFIGTGPAGAQVALMEGTTQRGSAIVAANGTWSVTSSALADGTHVLFTVARDATSGLTGPRSATINVTIDTVAPPTPVTAPDLATNSDTGLSFTDNVTRDNTPQFDGTVPANDRVNLFADGVLVGTDATTTAGSYAIVSSALSDGVRQMVVRFEDVAGNISPGFSPALNITVDTVAPAAPTIAPDMTAGTDTGISSTDNITRDATPTFVGTRPLNVAVHLVQGNVIFGQVLTIGSLSYSITSTTLGDNSYNFAAIFEDVAGNKSPAGPTLPVTIDTVAPALREPAAFHFLTGHSIIYAFTEDVGATLSVADLAVQVLTPPGGSVPGSSMALGYAPATNVATFTFPRFTGGILPDADYRARMTGDDLSDVAGNPFAGSQFDFFFLNGDANRDRRVNLGDFNILAANFGQSNRNFGQGDFNYDGTVNLADFNLLASRFGAAVGPAGKSPGDLESQGREQLLDEQR
jgi:hypothetical protein